MFYHFPGFLVWLYLCLFFILCFLGIWSNFSILSCIDGISFWLLVVGIVIEYSCSLKCWALCRLCWTCVILFVPLLVSCQIRVLDAILVAVSVDYFDCLHVCECIVGTGRGLKISIAVFELERLVSPWFFIFWSYTIAITSETVGTWKHMLIHMQHLFA